MSQKFQKRKDVQVMILVSFLQLQNWVFTVSVRLTFLHLKRFIHIVNGRNRDLRTPEI